MKDLDKYRGCLIGGAVGDALGYAVEFLQDDQIFQRYGEKGITEFSLVDGVAPISDDTQMTLFTANGLLVGATRKLLRGITEAYTSYISFAYKDWLLTQGTEQFGKEPQHSSWLNNVDELNHSREPGRTCISSIIQGCSGTIENPINSSKGCGGVMRVAPIGLYLGDQNIPDEEVAELGAKTAALTHGHPLGYIPAAAFAHIINLVSHNKDIPLLDAVNDSLLMTKRLFSQSRYFCDFSEIMEKAIKLSREDLDDLDAIYKIGQGWVAEETLAIAIYCALKYSNDFEKAIIASVNHSGDSDSTGSVTGNILGAYLGLSKIPQKFLDNLELKDVITEIADDLYNDCQMNERSSYYDEKWIKKYVEFSYRR